MEIIKEIRKIIATVNVSGVWRSRSFLLSLLVILILSAGLGLMVCNQDKTALLLADDQPLAVVSGREQVDRVLEDIIQSPEIESGRSIKNLATVLSYDKKALEAGQQPVTDEALKELLQGRLDWGVACWTIKIADVPKLYLASEDEANKALEGIKNYYLPDMAAIINLEDVRFEETVEILEAVSTVSQLKTVDEAVEAMVKGLDVIVQHTVKSGDNLWTIAKKQKMTEKQLREINPDIKGDFLKIGQKINLVKSEPLLTVLATYTETRTESIPFNTLYENDDSLWRGQQRVKQYGTSGSKQVTYRKALANEEILSKDTLAEKVLTQPISKIVRAGTRAMTVASRTTGGNGILGWPTRGKINSPYGVKRGRTYHTGTDIDGEIGDPIFSAGDGVVISAAWNGNYGKCIDIDHGRGLVTRYGHLSDINVKVGQQVSRGEFIGRLGSTGRSTGPHLHFEVRLNGTPQNPMNYLER